jgi:exonuclease III
MKVISWNNQGLNSSTKHRALKSTLNKEKSSILMIHETKCTSEVLQRISTKYWSGCHSIVIDAEGASSGLEFLWNPNEILLSDFFSTRIALSSSFRLMGSNQNGILSNVYSPQTAPEKVAFLQSL